MQFGYFVEPQVGGSYADLVKLAQWSESQGLDVFARSDHYLNGSDSAPATDAIASLAAVAIETSEIRLETLVSPLTFRHPAVMAKSATTIDDISGGRFTLGVGTGWMESEHEAFGLDLPPLRERFARLEESLRYLRTAFSGGGTFEGEYYRFDLPAIHPPASPGLEIVIGGTGERKTPTLAGRYGDEYNMFVTDKESLDARLGVFRAAAADAGRSPDSILVSFAGPAFVYGSEEEHRAALETRGARRNMGPDEYAAFLDARSVPHGSPDAAADAIDRMASWGIGRYYVQDFTALDEIDLDHMAAVFTALRRQ